MTHNDSAHRVRTHTPDLSARTTIAACGAGSLARGAGAGWRTRRAALVAVSCAAIVFAARAVHAQEWREVPARVIWARESLVYMAADSGALVTGMPLLILRGKRHVGEASVERLLEPRLAVARLSQGSLAAEKRLDKLRVRAGAVPASFHGKLRVGLPAAARANLLFACRTPRWNGAQGGYVADTLTRGLVALRRVPGNAMGGTEPDTLLVRFFADAADQEIALERGELDVAVFWPGELSARMRADARWAEPLRVRRIRGVLACTGADSLAPDPEALGILQRDVFAGDLEPLAAPARPGIAPQRLARLEPDPAPPGAALLARALGVPGARGPALRLAYLPNADPMALPPESRGVFALRCVVLTSPALREGWPAHAGAAELANLLQCEGP